MKPPIPVVAVLVSNRWGGYLFGVRRESHGAGLWALPGGHVEPGEHLWQTCEREVKEETNLDVSNIEFLMMRDYVYKEIDKSFIVMFFSAVMETKSAELKNMEPNKCEGWYFFAPDEFPKPCMEPLGELIPRLKHAIKPGRSMEYNPYPYTPDGEPINTTVCECGALVDTDFCFRASDEEGPLCFRCLRMKASIENKSFRHVRQLSRPVRPNDIVSSASGGPEYD